MMNNRLTEKQQKLIVDNYAILSNYVEKTINKKNIPRYLEDEFISEIFLRFCFSALGYVEDKGFKFSTYAYGGFNFGLSNIFANNKIKNIYYSEDIYKYELEYEEIDKLEISLLENIINEANLNPRDEFIMKDYYYNKLSLREVGEKYNISKEGTRLIIKRSLKKIRFLVEKRNLDIKDFYVKESK